MGVIAMFLALVGLYGTVSYNVGERQHEFAIRIALGARPLAVMKVVMAGFSRVVVAGLLAGLAAAAALSAMLARELYGLSHLDPASYAAAGTLLLLTGAAAAAIPASRASHVDPATALKHE